MIYTVTLNPAVDKTMIVPRFSANTVNRAERIILDPGGKGINVSKSIKALGGESVCLGIVGGDTGRYILSALDDMDLKHDMVIAEMPTRTNTKIVDPVFRTNTDLNEAGAAVSLSLLAEVQKKLHKLAKTGDTVIFAGKNPPGAPDDLLAQWTNKLCAAGIRVCVDTVGAPMKHVLREYPFLIKPNTEELEEIVGKSLHTQADVIAAAKELAVGGVSVVAVSMGADGAVFVTKDETVRSYAPKVDAVSTVGAGDAMMAALAYYAEKERSLKELAQMATAVATATVLVEGSKPASLDAVNAMREQIIVEKC